LLAAGGLYAELYETQFTRRLPRPADDNGGRQRPAPTVFGG
jgi:hypothetical protein